MWSEIPSGRSLRAFGRQVRRGPFSQGGGRVEAREGFGA